MSEGKDASTPISKHRGPSAHPVQSRLAIELKDGEDARHYDPITVRDSTLFAIASS